MFSFSLFFTLLLAACAVAQNISYPGYDPSSEDPATLSAWCKGETDNCPLLCGGRDFTTTNNCFTKPLSYKCTCKNGTAPYLVGYLNTFDNHVCQAAFAKCRVDNPGSQSCPKCGTLKATDVQPSTASTSAAASSTAAGTSGGTAAAPAATSSPTNAAMMIGAELGIKGAVGLLAAMGLML